MRCNGFPDIASTDAAPLGLAAVSCFNEAGPILTKSRSEPWILRLASSGTIRLIQLRFRHNGPDEMIELGLGAS